jgi:hypothetical protein
MRDRAAILDVLDSHQIAAGVLIGAGISLSLGGISLILWNVLDSARPVSHGSTVRVTPMLNGITLEGRF